MGQVLCDCIDHQPLWGQGPKVNALRSTSRPGQEVVSDSLALLNGLLRSARGSRAAAPKGTKSCRTQGEFLSVRLPVSVHPSLGPLGCLHQPKGGLIHVRSLIQGLKCLLQAKGDLA